METKRTAFDNFIENIIKTGGTKLNINGRWIIYFDLDTFELERKKTKEMEKNQIMNAYSVCDDCGTSEETEFYAEKYYAETYERTDL